MAATGASVGSIYGQMILDTSQYEAALRQLVGLTSKGGKNIESSIDKMSERLDVLEGKAKKNEKTFEALANSVSAAGNALGAGKIVAGFQAMSGEAAKFETLRTSFNVMLGDIKKGEKVVQDINKYSIDTPFTPEQSFRAGRALTAFRIEADKLIPTMQAIGDVSAGTGKEFTELSVIYGKAKVAGTLYAEDINQLLEAGVPILGEFAKQLGVNENQIKKLGSEGKITFDMLEKAFVALTTEGGAFAGMTKELSKTMEGMKSTLEGNSDEIKKFYGEDLNSIFKPILSGLNSVTGAIIVFRNESPATFRAIVLITSAAAGLVAIFMGGAGLYTGLMVIIPAIKAFGIAMNLSLGPIGLVAAGIAGLILLYAQLEDSVQRAMNAIKNRAEEAAKKNGEVSKETKEQLIQWRNTLSNTSDDVAKIVVERNAIKAVQSLKDLNAEMKSILTQQIGSVRGGGIEALKALDTIIGSLAVKTKELKTPSGLSGIKDTTLTLLEFVSAYRKMDALSERPIEFSIDYSDFEDAKKAIDELSKKGIRSEMNFVADTNTNAVITRVKFTAPDGTNLDENTIRNIAYKGKNFSGPIDVKLQPKTDIDMGMFEPLRKGLTDIFRKDFFNTTFGQFTSAFLSGTSKLVDLTMLQISSAAQYAQVQLQNMTNQMNFWTTFATKQFENELKLKEAAWDAEIKALQDQKDELLRIEEEYNRKRDEQKNAEIENIKKRIQEEYNVKAAAMQAENLAAIEAQYENLTNEDLANYNEELLTEEHLQALIELRELYKQMEADEIAALNNQMNEEDTEHKAEQVQNEKTLAQQIAEIEKKKADEQKKVEEQKAIVARDAARLQWLMGFSAFQIQKQAAVMQAKIQTAMMIIDITRAAFSLVPFTLPLLGFLPMAYSAGSMAIAAAGASQYPPPPATAFAHGGLAEGGIPGKDSIPSMLMPGELVVPEKNFEEVVGAVRGTREFSNQTISPIINIDNMNLYGITDVEEFARQVDPVLSRMIRQSVEAYVT